MDGKPKFSARETYVLDPDEISQLDELSLTSVMRQVTDPIEEPQKERDRNPLESEIARSTSVLVDAAIDELLDRSISTTEPLSDNWWHSYSETTTEPEPVVDPLDDPVTPGLLFPEKADEGDDDGAP